MWLIQIGMAIIAGIAIGDACISTRSIELEDQGRLTRWCVEVYLLGFLVNEDTGWVTNSEDGPHSPPRAVTRTQLLWIYGLPASTGLIMAVVAVMVARSFARLPKDTRDVLGEQLPRTEDAERVS